MLAARRCLLAVTEALCMVCVEYCMYSALAASPTESKRALISTRHHGHAMAASRSLTRQCPCYPRGPWPGLGGVAWEGGKQAELGGNCKERARAFRNPYITPAHPRDICCMFIEGCHWAMPPINTTVLLTYITAYIYLVCPPCNHRTPGQLQTSNTSNAINCCWAH